VAGVVRCSCARNSFLSGVLTCRLICGVTGKNSRLLKILPDRGVAPDSQVGQDDLVTPDLLAGRRAVVFDFYGTLTPVSPPSVWAANASGLARVMGVPAAELSRTLDQTFGDRITGELGDVRQTMRTLASRLGVRLTDQQVAEASRIRREVQETMFGLRPETLPVIGELRERGLRIGLVSDCTSELPDAWQRLPLDGVVDAPVFSCVERMRKPDPRLFRKVAADLRTDPGHCLYVGDGGGNELSGATAVGMRAVLLAGPDWQQNRDHNRETSWAGARISSLTELLD
jgi:putative hydrolase of the HAD superfamily